MEQLRNFFGSPGTIAPDNTAANTAATEAAGAAPTSPGESPETVARSGTGTENGTNPAGDGTGRGQGSRTVACQRCALPQYPESALEAGVEGTPRVQVEINPDGTVRSATLVQSSGNAAIDQAAIQAARSSVFQPVAGGASVPIEYDLTIEGSRRNREAQRRGDRRSVEVPDEGTETTSQTAREAEAESTPNPTPDEARNTNQESDTDLEADNEPEPETAPSGTESAGSAPQPEPPAPAPASPAPEPTADPTPASESEPPASESTDGG